MILCEKMYNTISEAGLMTDQLKEEYEFIKSSYKEVLLDELDAVVEDESTDASSKIDEDCTTDNT